MKHQMNKSVRSIDDSIVQDHSSRQNGMSASPPAYGIGLIDNSARRENRMGLPDKLKSAIERLSGLALDDVRVHYDSSKPARLQASAYTEGTEIYVGPGQEKHLPHEAWHVVQQKEGRVRPTVQMEDFALNDDAVLEKEADIMGAKARVRYRRDRQEARPETNTPAEYISAIPSHGPSDVIQCNGDEKTRPTFSQLFTSGKLFRSDLVMESQQRTRNLFESLDKAKEEKKKLKKRIADAETKLDDLEKEEQYVRGPGFLMQNLLVGQTVGGGDPDILAGGLDASVLTQLNEVEKVRDDAKSEIATGQVELKKNEQNIASFTTALEKEKELFQKQNPPLAKPNSPFQQPFTPQYPYPRRMR